MTRREQDLRAAPLQFERTSRQEMRSIKRKIGYEDDEVVRASEELKRMTLDVSQTGDN